MVTTLDKYGRLIIPKRFREHLGITQNTNLNIKEEGKRIVIEPIQDDDVIVNKEGILVYTGNISGGTEELLKTNRSNRLKKVASQGK